MNHESSQGIERRHDYQEIVTTLAVIKQQLKDIIERWESMHAENRVLLQKHGKIIEGDGAEGLLTKIIVQMNLLQDVVEKLNNHIKWDQWLFGILLTVILFIAGKLISGTR